MCSKSQGGPNSQQGRASFSGIKMAEETHRSSNRGGGKQHTVYCSVIFFRTFKVKNLCYSFTGIEPHVLCLAALCSKAVVQRASTYEFILALTKILVAPGYRAKDFSSPTMHVVFGCQGLHVKIVKFPNLVQF